MALALQAMARTPAFSLCVADLVLIARGSPRYHRSHERQTRAFDARRGKEYLAAIGRLTRAPVSHVVYSRLHYDHIGSADPQAGPGCDLPGSA
jgi:glyoxylase-like metal-dependent hydrolase (beta-lactamase superfamily II)